MQVACLEQALLMQGKQNCSCILTLPYVTAMDSGNASSLSGTSFAYVGQRFRSMLTLITYIHVGRQNCSNAMDGVNVIFASLHGSNLLEQRRSSCRGAKK